MPPYFKQHNKSACSLAALRSVLALKGLIVSEEDLIEKVEPDYGGSFSNLWNPTIAKLALEYDIDTTMYADWPLFKPELLQQVLDEYHQSPDTMDIQRYESPDDGDSLPEPLTLAYKEMFRAIELGCKTMYGGLSRGLLTELLERNLLVQTSIKTKLLYPGERDTYHSILIYALNDANEVVYHDPAREPSMVCPIDVLINAANGTGACLVYDWS
ncbi:MAG: hypothetical protein JWM81_308 [Candidatus Saccharibacteria bacterium]|nr:hypothetical protein [Candidatus Saccharibacteria bacterium]